MKILTPIDSLEEWLSDFPKRPQEAGGPQELQDEPQALAQMLGRQRVTYEPVWQALDAHPDKWVPVLCNSYRRAILLASSAIQHRSKAVEVWRRGRLVCLRLLQEKKQLAS